MPLRSIIGNAFADVKGWQVSAVDEGFFAARISENLGLNQSEVGVGADQLVPTNL